MTDTLKMNGFEELSFNQMEEIDGGFSWGEFAGSVIVGVGIGGLGGAAVGGIGAAPGALGGGLLGGATYLANEILGTLFGY